MVALASASGPLVFEVPDQTDRWLSPLEVAIWRYFGENPFGHSGDASRIFTRGSSVTSEAPRSGYDQS